MLKILITIASVAAILSTSTSIGFAPAQKQKASDEKLIVGILRPDSVIIPFAQYANRKWSNPWHSAQPDDQANEPDTIADLPKPWFDSFVKSSSEWYLWSSSGVATTLTTSKTVQVCSHCQQVWGLLTDYPNAKQPEKNECVRNVGAVLSEKRHARAMEKLTDASPDWKQIMTFVGPEFERAESVGLSSFVAAQYASQIPPAEERAKVPLTVLNLYRSQLSEDGQVLFYFEASKEYPKPPESNDSGCNNISLLGGWALRDAQGNLALLHTQFEPTDCDMKEGDLIIPFVILQLDGKTFAIVEEDGYEGEGYKVLEIEKHGVHLALETYAGSC